LTTHISSLVQFVFLSFYSASIPQTSKFEIERFVNRSSDLVEAEGAA